MTYDLRTKTLYVVESKYRRLGKEIVPSILLDRQGLGRLWKKHDGRPAVPLSRITLTPAELSQIERDVSSNALFTGEWKAKLTGVLRYPTDILLDDSPNSLLIVQAGSGLWRFRLADAKFGLIVPIEQCMNLMMAVPQSRNVALLYDGGVHPNGYGRLMRCNLKSRKNTILAGGWSQIGGIALDSKRRRILVTQGYSWPAGRVFALDARPPYQSIVAEWTGLNRPGCIILDERRNAALVSSADGICELEL
jgi:hypothetical protein